MIGFPIPRRHDRSSTVYVYIPPINRTRQVKLIKSVESLKTQQAERAKNISRFSIEQQDDLETAAILLIPDDVLVDVFRRVGSPRALALSRCVCRAWRFLIDDRQLLRADLLPLSLCGLILCLNVEGEMPELFARPSVDVTGYLMPSRIININDHCNGLILIYNTVRNPATGRLVRLPSLPPLPPLWQEPRFLEKRYLAFDPVESPHHYQVFCIPMVQTRSKPMEDPAYRAMSQSEWPPSPLVFRVFSSVTGRWETRSLARQGGAITTVHDLDSPPTYRPQHSACWRGALYVHCHNDFVLRIPILLSDDQTTRTYQVVKPPIEPEDNHLCGRLGRSEKGVYKVLCGCLGRSEKGIYFASFDFQFHLCLWILHHHFHDDDPCHTGCHMEWILKHRSDCGLALPTSLPRSASSWTLHNAIRDEDGDLNAQEWDSDDDGFHTETEDRMVQEQLLDFTILGFHPYREIVFMEADYRGMAYHLKTSKLDDLGSLFPKDGTHVPGCVTMIENAFPYTPCWMGAGFGHI